MTLDPDPLDATEYMCPNCVTPWKCNGIHIPDPRPFAPPGYADRSGMIVVYVAAALLFGLILAAVAVLVVTRPHG